AKRMFGKNATVFHHAVGHLAMGGGVDDVEPAAQYTDCRKVVTQGLLVSVDIDPIGEPADDQGTMGDELFNKLLHAGTPIDSRLTRSHNGYCFRVLKVNVAFDVQQCWRIGRMSKPCGI